MLSEEAPEVEGVLARLRAEAVITAEDVHHIKHVLALLDDAGVLGMEPAQLLVSTLPSPGTGGHGTCR